ncbi:MAG: crossover junction endodeoxyribonuclease RuvC [Deltaproteobacteria bacterium]|nr:crossover junction endodeoxyribonuclease RuvC [Deltaproteobacteria bacterium]
MRVIGIDPGSNITGYGILEEKEDSIRYVDSGIIEVPNNLSFPKKLRYIYSNISRLIMELSPDELAIETIFLDKNVATVIKLGHIRGVLILSATNAGLEIFEYSPLQIKISVVGYGQATKDQVKVMVKRLLSLKKPLQNDESDALAVAICHIHSNKLMKWAKSTVFNKKTYPNKKVNFKKKNFEKDKD